MAAWSGFGGFNLQGPSGRQQIQFDPNLFKDKGWNAWRGSATHLGPDAQRNMDAELFFEDEAGNVLGGGKLGATNGWDLSNIDPSKSIFARWNNAGPNGLALSGNGRMFQPQGAPPAPAYPGSQPTAEPTAIASPASAFGKVGAALTVPGPDGAVVAVNGFGRGTGTINFPGNFAGPGQGAPNRGAGPGAGGGVAAPSRGQGTGPGNPGAGSVNTTPGQPQSWQDLVASLFGGNQAGNENRQIGRTGLDPRLDALYNTFLGEAVNRYNDPNGQQFYEGSTVAGLTPDELAAQQYLRNLSGGMGDFAGAGMDYYRSTLANAQNGGQSPQLQGAIDAMAGDVTQQANDPGGIFSQIRQNSLAHGSFGGTRQGVAEGLAQGRIAEQIARRSAEMRLGAQQQATAAAQGALGAIPNITSAATTPASLLSAVGGQNRQLDQQRMDDNLRRWAYNTFEPDRRLQNIFQLMGSAPLGGYQTGQSWTGEDFMQGGNDGTSSGQNAAAIIGAILGGWNLFGN